MMVIGYFLQVLGMALFALGVRRSPGIFGRTRLFAHIAAGEAVVIALLLLSDIPSITLGLTHVMNVLHGMVAGHYLVRLSTSVQEQYRGRAFGFGYSFGSIGTWVLSLPLGGTFLASRQVAIVYVALIAVTVFLDNRLNEQHRPAADVALKNGSSPQPVMLAFIAVALLSLVKNVGFYFPSADISQIISIEFSRAFYAVGLVCAGIICDKYRRYSLVCCIAALVFPFLSIPLQGNPEYATINWILAYVFLGFFAVYRVTVFSDISAKRPAFLPLAAAGLLAGRLGDAVGTIAGIRLSGSMESLLAVTGALFIVVVFLFFRLYHELYLPGPAPRKNVEAQYTAFEGEYGLTRRESEIFRLVMQGLSNSEIADALYVSESTVKFHVGNILDKSGCSNRTQLLALFKKQS